MGADDDPSETAVDALALIQPHRNNDHVVIAGSDLVLYEHEQRRLSADGLIDAAKPNGLLFIDARTDESVAVAISRCPHGSASHLSLLPSAMAAARR